MILPGNVVALYRCAWRYWSSHRWQLALLVLGMAIGVAVVFAVDIANSSAKRAMAMSLDAVTGRTTHQIIAQGGVDEAVYTRLRVQHGLRQIAPLVTGNVDVRGESFQLMGVDLFAESAVRDQFVSGDGSVAGRGLLRLMDPDSLLIARRTADRFELAVGDRLELNWQGRVAEFTIAGVLGGTQQAAMDNLLFVDIAVAQSLLGMQGKLSQIDLIVEDDAQLSRIAEMVPQYTLSDAARRNNAVMQMTAAFHTNLQAMSLLALLVGGFLIYNTVTLSVLQRRRLFGLLRVAGVTRRELGMAIIAEVLFFAIIATVLGLLLGYVIGNGLLTLITRTINDLYFALGVKRIEIEAFVVVRAILLGIAAALIAALAPALEASRSQPATVLQRSVIERKTSGVLLWLFVCGCLLLLLGWGLTLLTTRSLIIGFTALFVIVFGYTLLIPGAMKVCVQWFERMSRTGSSALGLYPVRSLTANLSRSSVAVASLAVALSATAGVGIMIGSFRISVAEWLDSTLEADVYISDSESGFDERLISDIGKVEGIESRIVARAVTVETDRQPMRLLAIETQVDAMRRFTIKPGAAVDYQAQLENGTAVMVSEPLSWKAGLAVGDTLVLSAETGPLAVEVAAIFIDYGTGPGTVVLDLSQYREHWRDSNLSSVGIYLRDDASVDSVVESLREIGRAQSAPFSVRATGEIKQASLEIFDRTFAVTSVLRWLTILVAFIGILSALMAQMLERSREFSVLHALGVTRAELRLLVVRQTFLIGCIAGVLALPLGFVMSRLLVDVINRRSFGWTMQFHVPGQVLIETLALALLAAVVAGLYPAYRIARARHTDARGST
jgi:putative ABC transport system permease protein